LQIGVAVPKVRRSGFSHSGKLWAFSQARSRKGRDQWVQATPVSLGPLCDADQGQSSPTFDGIQSTSALRHRRIYNQTNERVRTSAIEQPVAFRFQVTSWSHQGIESVDSINYLVNYKKIILNNHAVYFNEPRIRALRLSSICSYS
jgi:hypothetical protein